MTAALLAKIHLPFSWPAGKKAAVNLSFDDARLSQIDTGMALTKGLGLFFVQLTI